MASFNFIGSMDLCEGGGSVFFSILRPVRHYFVAESSLASFINDLGYALQSCALEFWVFLLHVVIELQ